MLSDSIKVRIMWYIVETLFMTRWSNEAKLSDRGWCGQTECSQKTQRLASVRWNAWLGGVAGKAAGEKRTNRTAKHQ